MIMDVPERRKMSLFYTHNINVYINTYIGVMLKFLTNLIKNVPKYNKLEDINFHAKVSGDNRGQWGYFVSRDVYPLLKLLERYNISSLCDLGSGVGIFLRALRDFAWFNLNVTGFEIEPLFVEIANDYFDVRTLKKNILLLKQEEIKEFEVLYIYEPFTSDEVRDNFFDNLLNIMVKGQLFFYKPANSSVDKYFSLVGDHRIKLVEDTIDFHVFRKL
jgi:SAM-dependent methyltransferase